MEDYDGWSRTKKMDVQESRRWMFRGEYFMKEFLPYALSFLVGDVPTSALEFRDA